MNAVELFAANLVQVLRTDIGLWFADSIKFAEDAEDAGTIKAEVPLYGGVLTLRASAAGQWDDAPAGVPIFSAGWGQHPAGSFTCGARYPGGTRAVWAVASAVAFAESHGTLPSEDD